MLINKATLDALFAGFNVIYQKAFQAYKPEYERIAMVVPSTTASENYAFLGAFPKMREWIGERQYKNLLASKYAVPNKDFESSVEIPRNDIQDDKIGLFNPFVAEVGRAAASHPDELVFALLPAGFTEGCYDGQPFFSAAHKGKDAKGKVISVSNMDVPESNPGNPWFLLDTSRAVKPVIFQNRKAPEFAALTNPESEHVFKNKSFIYGVDSRDNAGYGLWQFAFGSKQPLTPENYAKARAAMMAFTDAAGKLLQVKPDLLVVGGSNEGAARSICLGEHQASGASNPWRGTAEVMVTPHLL